MQWSAVTWRSASPAQQDVALGAAGGFIGRQPVTYLPLYGLGNEL
jgi:hypothetical protein